MKGSPLPLLQKSEVFAAAISHGSYASFALTFPGMVTTKRRLGVTPISLRRRPNGYNDTSEQKNIKIKRERERHRNTHVIESASNRGPVSTSA